MDIEKLLISLGIEPEKASECKEAITKELYKDFIPKGQYNKKTEENKALEDKIKELENVKIEKEKNAENEVLKDILARMEKYEQERQQETINIKKEQIKSELVKTGMNEQMVDLILKSSDLSGTNKEVIERLSNEYKDFIPTTQIEGAEATNKTNAGNDDNTYSKDEIAKMSEADLSVLIDKDPDFFTKISYK